MWGRSRDRKTLKLGSTNNGFAGNSIGEAFDVYDLKFMHPARDQFRLVASFQLKGEAGALDVNDACGASHGMADGSWGQVAHVNFQTDGAFFRLQPGQDGFPCGVLKEPEKPGRA